MSTRPVLPILKSCSRLQVRTVIHHARPTRTPFLASPSNPKPVKPTAGTSTPNPHAPSPVKTETILSDTGLVYDHNPPASAPSYISGETPDFLKWVGVAGPEAQQSVRLTGEEAARPRKTRTGRDRMKLAPELVEEMIAARAAGLTRTAIAEKFNLGSDALTLIARLAPASKDSRKAAEEALARQKESWGFRKSLAREKREERKKYW